MEVDTCSSNSSKSNGTKTKSPFLDSSDLTWMIETLLQVKKLTLKDPELRFDINPESAASNLNAVQKQE